MEYADTPERESGSPSGRTLSDAAHAALRSALGAQLRREPFEDPVQTARLRRAIRMLCDDARERGVRAEQLVIVIKHAWSSLPESRWRPGFDQGLPLLQRIVRICIEEYYSDRTANRVPLSPSANVGVQAPPG